MMVSTTSTSTTTSYYKNITSHWDGRRGTTTSRNDTIFTEI
jgi:hypothetical protein